MKIKNKALSLKSGIFLFLIGSTVLSSCSTHNQQNSALRSEVNRAQEENFLSFVIGPGDQIEIDVWRTEGVSRTVKVDPAGNINLPLIGELRAAGNTLSQLRVNITEKLEEYFTEPRVSLNVVNLISMKAYVLGEVRTPGTIQLDGDIMAWEAIAKAGGISNDGDSKRALLIRNQGDKPVLISLHPSLNPRKGKENETAYQKIRQRDIVYVPPKIIVDLESFMIRFNNIINPFVTVERAIILSKQAADLLSGTETASDVLISH